MIKEVIKTWGREEWLVNNEEYCAKYLLLNQGYSCSMHYHIEKDETFYVTRGIVELCVLKPEYSRNKTPKWADVAHKVKRIILNRGEAYRIKPYEAHRFNAVTPQAIILEVSTTHKDEDSYRITLSRKLTEPLLNGDGTVVNLQ